MRMHDAAFKAKVALEAVKGEKTLAQRFRRGVTGQIDKDHDELEAELYHQIGQLKVEVEWIKKNLRYSVKENKDEAFLTCHSCHSTIRDRLCYDWGHQ